MKGKLRIGVHGLDKVLGGGIPYRTNVLLIGKPGTGKSTLCYQVTKNSLEKGMSCLYITTAQTPKEILDRMGELDLDVEEHVEEKELLFVDCYSSRLGKSEGDFKIVNLSDLNALSVEIEGGLKSIKKYSLVIFDGLSDLLLASDLEKASKFLSVISAKTKSGHHIGIFTLVEDMHDKKTKTAIESLCDGTIKMTIRGEKRYIQVSRMKVTSHPLKKFEFSIKYKGIALKELEEFFEH